MRRISAVLVLVISLSTAAAGQRSVIGAVQSSTDSVALDGVVLTLNSDAVAVTDSLGEFRFIDVPGGTSLLAVRRIGFEPVELAIWVDSTLDLTISLHPSPFELEDIDVVAERATLSTRRLAREGFFERQKLGLGHHFDRQRIERLNPFYLTDLLRTLPGRYRRICQMYIDGVQAEQPLTLLKPFMLEAVEVYAAGADMPARFNATGCGGRYGGAVLVVWTR